jgi:hypothetical protein
MAETQGHRMLETVSISGTERVMVKMLGGKLTTKGPNESHEQNA